MDAVYTIRLPKYTLRIYRNEKKSNSHISLPRAAKKARNRAECSFSADSLRADYIDAHREDIQKIVFKQF